LIVITLSARRVMLGVRWFRLSKYQMRTDREKHGLRGSVKSVLVETAQFEEQDGQITEKPWFSHTSAFNQDGWLIEQVNRNPDGSEWRAVSDYSDSGKLLATRSFDASDALGREVRYIYDDEGRLVAEQHTTQDGNVCTPIAYDYERGSGKIKIQKLDFSGEANVMVGIEGTNTSVSAGEANRIETRYDDQGEAAEVKVFNTDGALVSRVEIVRDARGSPLEETQYVGQVVPFGTCAAGSCSTEEMAALTEEQKVEFASEIARLFSPGTAMSRQTHRYDEEGRLIESKLTMMGMEASRQSFAYDEAGNKTEEASYNEDGTLGSKAIFTRDYDEHGNWTKELVSTASSWDVEFGQSLPVHVTRRTITYYK
jgi:YD repeat-containing protein